MKNIKRVFFVLFAISFVDAFSQCNVVEVVTICDMTTIDDNSDGIPDGIINLFDEYNAITGGSISLATGTWFDPNYNFALDETTGELYLWDLNNASEEITDYQFLLIDNSSSCSDGILATVNLILGGFEGNPLPPQGSNDANITICEASLSGFDLFQVFQSQPSPHKNGVWAFLGNLGNPNNFISLSEEGKFKAQIPYEQGGDLIEFDVFEFSYTTPSILPCSTSRISIFKVEVIRDVQSGKASVFEICETDLLLGLWDNDINLRDDRFLRGEDIEGLWSSESDVTGQISGPLDSTINIREVYDFLKSTNPKYNCREYTYIYTVDARSSLSACEEKKSSVKFTFSEPIKPFQQLNPLEICLGSQPNSINLYDELVFTTENDFLYDYPNFECTNWTLISGPSSLGLVRNTGSICEIDIELDILYTSKGTLNLSNITNADAGTYLFQYEVDSKYLCNANSCNGQFANVALTIHPKLYVGEDTIGLQFCEDNPIISPPLDLFSLLTTNTIDDPVYQGPLGTWRDFRGNLVTNPITVAEINGKQNFDFTYTIRTTNGCVDSANLAFIIFEAYSSGSSNTVTTCTSNVPFNLFDELGGNPNNNGVWSGSDGYVTTDATAIFDPATSLGGVYTYTVPDNIDDSGLVICTGNQSTITMNIIQGASAGSAASYPVCKSDLQIDLRDYLVGANLGGTFSDIDNSNALIGSVLDVSQLDSRRYNFQYIVQNSPPCNSSSAIIAISIIDVIPPVVTNQTFCASEGATISDLQASNGTDFNWYETVTSTDILPFSTALANGEDYFVVAVDIDGCESSRIQIVVTLLPVNHVDCDDCIKDGLSPNNDGENDIFDLCNLPVSYPDFEIDIFNRYGNVVYVGNKNTSLFNGSSNVALTMGKELPSGVYFYVFDPKDGTTIPFQGNFYLSR